MKRFLFLCLPIPLPVVAAPKCQWVSESTTEAVLQIGSPYSLLGTPADLVWKGKVIRSLLIGHTQGPGLRWWAYRGKDGRAVGAGRRLLTFKGNQPIRGMYQEDLDQSALIKAQLIGLGVDLYTDFRGDWPLITAAEGFWQIPTSQLRPQMASLPGGALMH